MGLELWLSTFQDIFEPINSQRDAEKGGQGPGLGAAIQVLNPKNSKKTNTSLNHSLSFTSVPDERRVIGNNVKIDAR